MTTKYWNRLAFFLLFCSLINVALSSKSAPLNPSKLLTQTCKATIFDVEQKLENYRYAYVSDVNIYEIATDTNFSANTPLNLFISLGANDSKGQGDIITESAALNLLSSPKMLRSYSENIINNCQDIVSVQFFLTEYQFRKFGVIDGSVQAFRCADNFRSRTLRWGYQRCFN